MNMAEAIAFSALIIGLIAGAGIWLDAYKRRLTHRERELELQLRLVETRANDGGSDAGKLEQRLRVLERIATDPKRQLADRIDALREDRSKDRDLVS